MMRSSIGPFGDGRPSTPGNCDTRMCTEIPARKPTVTGTDSRLAIQPMRNRLPRIRITPTISASATASAWYSGDPLAAISSRPPAKIGVMVESAPQDRKRLAPNMAKPIDPTMKAKKPICGAKPPSRAVAICSGIAIAASVKPAMRSPGRLAARNARSERKTGQRLAERQSRSAPSIILLLADCSEIFADREQKTSRGRLPRLPRAAP